MNLFRSKRKNNSNLDKIITNKNWKINTSKFNGNFIKNYDEDSDIR